MPQPTYIDAMNRLMELAPIVGLPANQRLLMLALLHGWNRLGRPDSWRQSTESLCNTSGLSRKAATAARNGLSQSGFVEFEAGGRHHRAEYRLGSMMLSVSLSVSHGNTERNAGGGIDGNTERDTGGNAKWNTLQRKRREEEEVGGGAEPPTPLPTADSRSGISDGEVLRSDELSAGGDYLGALGARIAMETDAIVEAATAKGISREVLLAYCRDRSAEGWMTPRRRPVVWQNWIGDLERYAAAWKRHDGDSGKRDPDALPSWQPEHWREIATKVSGRDCSGMKHWKEIPLDFQGPFQMACREAKRKEAAR